MLLYTDADGLSALYERTEMSILNLFKTEKVSMKRTTKSTVTTSKVTKTAKTVAKKAPVANLAKVTNQSAFLETYLRGTGRTLSVAQAQANYGIQKLSARMSEFRKCGLKVETIKNTSGNTAYRVSARDVKGSRAKMFAI